MHQEQWGLLNLSNTGALHWRREPSSHPSVFWAGTLAHCGYLEGSHWPGEAVLSYSTAQALLKADVGYGGASASGF